MKDMSQDTKDLIFERANNRELYILRQSSGIAEIFPAKIYGRLLNYPVISAINNKNIKAEINWSQVERMSKGQLNYIEI